MDRNDSDSRAIFGDVHIRCDTGLAWLCRVNGREVPVPPLHTLPGTTVRWPTQRRGTLVIPRWLAINLGLS